MSRLLEYCTRKARQIIKLCAPMRPVQEYKRARELSAQPIWE